MHIHGACNQIATHKCVCVCAEKQNIIQQRFLDLTAPLLPDGEAKVQHLHIRINLDSKATNVHMDVNVPSHGTDEILLHHSQLSLEIGLGGGVPCLGPTFNTEILRPAVKV